MRPLIRFFEAIIHFYGRQASIVKHLILLIPIVNWFFELCFRWCMAYYGHKLMDVLIAIITLPFGVFLGWIDFCWRILTGHMIFAKPRR